MRGTISCRAERGAKSWLLVGIDAKANAVLKGRSSGPTLAAVVRRLAAHALAGGLMIYEISNLRAV